MARDAARTPRLLFVLSHDFGELANALSFVAGAAFDPLLLMPPRLWAVNRDNLPARVGRYVTADDIRAAVAEEAPDIVFLFSGYLYGVNFLLEVDALAGLLLWLRECRCRVVTSDPFLGALSPPDPSAFPAEFPRRQAFLEHFTAVSRLLAGLPHLDLAPVPAPPGRHRVSFFNERAFTMLPSPSGEGEGDAERPWLFLLSLEDYAGQTSLWGKARFERLLAERLRETAAAGRRPVLMAPQVCLDAVARTAPPIPGLDLRAFCGYRAFLSLLLRAEHAFYWNIFSNSVIARIATHRSVFFFDRGHLARAVVPLYQAGMTHYYNNATLPYLPFDEPLAPDRLAVQATQQEPALAPARDHVRRSSRPEDVVERLLSSDTRTR